MVVDEKSDFSIHNLPFGIFSTRGKKPRVGVAIGDQIVDLVAVARLGVFNVLKIDPRVFSKSTLNDFIALGKTKTSAVRRRLQQQLSSPRTVLMRHPKVLVPQSDATMHMPVQIGDYTDFYSSREHATNVGKMFRDPARALLPNWLHLPVAYHGRASSIVVSGTNIHRPKGQVMTQGGGAPVYQPSAHMDFELEMGFIIGKTSTLGEPISIESAEDYIFGMVLFNDWSARDIQKWEYVPLGPFLGKNFGSSISPWVVTMEALEPFRVSGPRQDPEVLPYLKYKGKKNYNITLTVSLQPEGSQEHIISKSNFRYMYWNMAQQLAHHTINGCNVQVGDLMASGTISGKDPKSYGSMLEITWGGAKPLRLKDGSERKFIHDNDCVIMRGYGQKDELRVGFGEVRGKVLPVK